MSAPRHRRSPLPGPSAVGPRQRSVLPSLGPDTCDGGTRVPAIDERGPFRAAAGSFRFANGTDVAELYFVRTAVTLKVLGHFDQSRDGGAATWRSLYESGGTDRLHYSSRRFSKVFGMWPRKRAGHGSRLFPTARTAVGTDSSPEHVLDQYRDAFEVAIGTGSIRGSERLWGPRLDWRCSMRPTCCRTTCSSRSTSTARMTERGPPARSDPLERTTSEGTVSVTQERAAQWTEAAIG